MSAGLAASTVTPGSTAPDVSLTTPTMLLCATAVAGPNAVSAPDGIVILRTISLIAPSAETRRVWRFEWGVL